MVHPRQSNRSRRKTAAKGTPLEEGQPLRERKGTNKSSGNWRWATGGGQLGTGDMKLGTAHRKL